MATEVIKTTFQLKRGLAESWNRLNPILAAGEPGWTLDTHVLKIGDGTTPWNNLNVISGVEINEADIQKAVNEYLDAHPITVETDTTLSVAGQPADAGAVRDLCLFNTDQIIFCAGDADDIIFN